MSEIEKIRICRKLKSAYWPVFHSFRLVAGFSLIEDSGIIIYLGPY